MRQRLAYCKLRNIKEHNLAQLSQRNRATRRIILKLSNKCLFEKTDVAVVVM